MLVLIRFVEHEQMLSVDKACADYALKIAHLLKLL